VQTGHEEQRHTHYEYVTLLSKWILARYQSISKSIFEWRWITGTSSNSSCQASPETCVKTSEPEWAWKDNDFRRPKLELMKERSWQRWQLEQSGIHPTSAGFRNLTKSAAFKQPWHSTITGIRKTHKKSYFIYLNIFIYFQPCSSDYILLQGFAVMLVTSSSPALAPRPPMDVHQEGSLASLSWKSHVEWSKPEFALEMFSALCGRKTLSK
jgi:hypothetical protein